MYLVVYRDEWVVWRERPCGTFPVDKQGFLFPIHHMLLHFGNVVRDIVDHVHVKVVRRCCKHFGKGLKEAAGVKTKVRPKRWLPPPRPAPRLTCLVRKVMDERLTQA